MAKLEIKFSAAEMLLITASMKISSFFNLDQLYQTHSEDELKTILATARDSLMARGLVRAQEQNGEKLLDLHPIVKAAVGVVARPEKGFWLTINEQSQKPRSIFFSWTEKLLISNWLTQEHIFCFKQVEEEALSSEILKFSMVTPQDEGKDRTEYEVPVAILDAIAENEKSSSFKLQQLTRSGIVEDDAKQILEGMESPLERCILISVSNMREQPQNTGLIIWLVIEGKIWLIEQSHKDENIAILKKVSGNDVLEAISSLTDQTLANA